jgi:hypothetical protein
LSRITTLTASSDVALQPATSNSPLDGSVAQCTAS